MKNNSSLLILAGLGLVGASFLLPKSSNNKSINIPVQSSTPRQASVETQPLMNLNPSSQGTEQSTALINAKLISEAQADNKAQLDLLQNQQNVITDLQNQITNFSRSQSITKPTLSRTYASSYPIGVSTIQSKNISTVMSTNKGIQIRHTLAKPVSSPMQNAYVSSLPVRSTSTTRIAGVLVPKLF